ncbi:MAG: hypothetical protein CMJ64_08755 [Planctomycetaceae bacterium]|nr:hypothetical protein [Planctomycetaceae bacterium]
MVLGCVSAGRSTSVADVASNDAALATITVAADHARIASAQPSGCASDDHTPWYGDDDPFEEEDNWLF